MNKKQIRLTQNKFDRRIILVNQECFINIIIIKQKFYFVSFYICL